VNEPEIT